MRRLILFFVALLPLTAMAQSVDFAQMFAKYSNKQGFTTVELSREALGAMGVGDGINSLRAITIEDAEYLPIFTADIEPYLSGMKRIMAVVNGDKSVNVYSRSNNLILIYTCSAKNATLLCLTGDNVSLKQAGKLLGVGR